MQILLLILLLYLLYRLFVPSKRSSKASKVGKQKTRYAPQNSHSQNAPQQMIIDEMKRCPTCGTYNPKSHTVVARGNYYCNEECRAK